MHSVVIEMARIFLVDDHELVRRGLREILTEAGGIEIVGESGLAREAARRIPALRPDVALLDARLPDGSGIEVCREIRSRDPSIHAIILTSYDDNEALTASVLAGASGYILKQIHGPDLAEAVRRVAAGESLMDRTTAFQIPARATESNRRNNHPMTELTPQEERVLDLIEDASEGLLSDVRKRLSNVVA